MASHSSAQIGSGSFAIVRRVKDTAVKKYRKRPSEDLSDDIFDIVNETAALVRLKGCAQVPEFLGLTHPWTLTMSLHGPNLINSPAKGVEATDSLLGDLLMGVCFMHKRGIAHRDITIGNVLWKDPAQRTNKFVICDFGWAINVDIVGEKVFKEKTTYRMPPEAAHGSGITTADGVKALDVYCVGEVVKIQMLSQISRDLEPASMIIKKLQAPVKKRLTAEEGLELFKELISNVDNPDLREITHFTKLQKEIIFERGIKTLEICGKKLERDSLCDILKPGVQIFQTLHDSGFIRSCTDTKYNIYLTCSELAGALVRPNLYHIQPRGRAELMVKIMQHLAFDLHSLV